MKQRKIAGRLPPLPYSIVDKVIGRRRDEMDGLDRITHILVILIARLICQSIHLDGQLGY